MTHRERFHAVLHGLPYDRMPCCAYGYWPETIDRWEAEGHLPVGTAEKYREIRAHRLPDDSLLEREIDELLGFDFNAQSVYAEAFPLNCSLYPFFEEEIPQTMPDGSRILRNYEGVIMLQKMNGSGGRVSGISPHLEHTLVDRVSWEKEYKPRLQFTESRFDPVEMELLRLESTKRERVLGLHCGSMLGQLRNWMGFEDFCCLPVEDPELFEDMVDTIGELLYRNVEFQLKSGIVFDYAHFWEDLCCNNGAMVIPRVYYHKVGPWYRRITELLKEYGIDLVTVDCDGKVDMLVPTWIENGINVLFPIEYSVWGGSIAPFREKYGYGLRGIGGMRKLVLGEDRSAIDAELERLKPLVELGGYIPCPDHRISPEATWENVRYYTERFKEIF